MSGIDYIFTAKVMLTKDGVTGTDTPTTCVDTGKKCLKVQTKIRDDADHNHDVTMNWETQETAPNTMSGTTSRPPSTLTRRGASRRPSSWCSSLWGRSPTSR